MSTKIIMVSVFAFFMVAGCNNSGDHDSDKHHNYEGKIPESLRHLAIVPSGKSLDITWSPVKNTSAYQVFYSSVDDPAKSEKTDFITGTSYTISE